MKSKILLIEDNEAARFGYARFLNSTGYDVVEAEDLSSADRMLAAQKFDAAIVDINLPDGSGLELIEKLRGSSPEMAIVVITGAGDIPLAVTAMRKGADNFLTKPVDMEGLEVFLKKNLETGAIRKFHTIRQRLIDREGIWFGVSSGMKEAISIAKLAAENDSPVLITGETGTGKGVLAKWIHRKSSRVSFGFVDVNCSGLNGDLLARELFGNVRGAFTSADRDRDGLLDAADRGTLFLDEICEMDLAIQAQFLKILEEKTYRRLGDTKQQKSDFRLICATNKNIEAEVQKGAFRNDLFFRINLLTLHIPPLRERIEDLPIMVQRIVGAKSSGIEIADDAMDVLKTYPWPGNVRELKNVLERAKILSRGGPLKLEHFSWLNASPRELFSGQLETLADMTYSHMLAALERFGGNVPKAAKHLGISRATFYRKLKQLKTSAPPGDA